MVAFFTVIIISLLILLYLVLALDCLLKWKSSVEIAFDTYDSLLNKARRFDLGVPSSDDEMHNRDELREEIEKAAADYNEKVTIYNKRINRLWIRSFARALHVKKIEKL